MNTRTIDLIPSQMRPRSQKRRVGPSIWLRGLARWTGRALLAFILVSFVLVGFWGVVPVPVTPLMAIRVADRLLEGEIPRFKKDWVPLEEISPRLLKAVIVAEDHRFIEHRGFDFKAIDQAIQHNRNNTKKRGASTISQQVAKNVFLWPSRSWVRKGFEVWFTTLIETLWSKRRIMEVYLNVIEIGDGVYGAEAAARTFFRKPAANLNAHEAALIAAVLPNPFRLRVDRPSKYVQARKGVILRRMNHISLNELR